MKVSSLYSMTVIPISKVQVSRVPRRNASIVSKAVQIIRIHGQQRPLIIDSNYRLLSDAVAYVALKESNYRLVWTFMLKNPSPDAIRAVSRLMDCSVAMRRETIAFNAALRAVGRIVSPDVRILADELLPFLIAGR